MFGKRIVANEEKEEEEKEEEGTPDLVVNKKETVGMTGFTKDAPTPEPVAVAPAPAPVAKPIAQYQIVEVGLSAVEGLYVYKIVTNQKLGELGGVYEA